MATEETAHKTVNRKHWKSLHDTTWSGFIFQRF